MGYYTYYTMGAHDTKTNAPVNEELEKTICERLYAISKGAIFEAETFEECLDDSLKWYDHFEDMLSLSVEFPDVVFILEGEGEERDDNWRLFVQNGMWEEVRARIMWDSPTNKNFWSLDY